MDIDERLCPECGAEVENPAAATPVAGSGAPDARVFGSGSRNNISGSVNTSTTNTNHTNTNIQTSSVDNSSVVNNTTIVMEGKKTPEFCEVCGSPFEGKHARCPKCGKMICFDCKVKGKNRCVECEKKAVNEYRLAFQQLLLTTNENIGAAGRQMMNQKARDLDVEDVKAGIEKELMEEYGPAPRAEQPTVVPNKAKAMGAAGSSTSVGSKGDVFVSLPPAKGGGGLKWLVLAVLVVVVAGAFLWLGRGGSSEEQAVAPEVTEQTVAPVTSPGKPAAPASQPDSKAQPAPTTQPTPKVQTTPIATPAPKPVAEPKRDANYEAGMAAYNKGEGLEAISKFKASGSAEANYMLGVIYEKGCGNVGANAMMARSFYKKAANQGYEAAKAKL